MTALLEVSFLSYSITSMRYVYLLAGTAITVGIRCDFTALLLSQATLGTVAVVYLRPAAVTDRGASAMP